MALWVGNPAITSRPLPVVGYMLLATVLYVATTALLGRRFFARVGPWTGAAILDAPVVLVLVPVFPDPLRLGWLLFFAVSMVCAGACAYGGCEVLAIPNMLLRKTYNIACPVFSPIDWVEAKVRTRRGG